MRLSDIIEDYRKIHATWQGAEHELRDTCDTAIAETAIAKTKSALHMDQLRSEFDHIKPEDIEKKIKESSMADMAIMITNIAQVVPVLGDIWGGNISIL